MNLHLALKHLHSGWRYVVLVLVILAIISAVSGWLGKNNYTPANRKLNLFTLIAFHIQALIGLVLYFVSPKVRLDDMASAMKDSMSRYWTVEHILMMIIAAVLITVGHSKSKKISESYQKHKTIAIFYSIAVIIVIVAIQMSGIPVWAMS